MGVGEDEYLVSNRINRVLEDVAIVNISRIHIPTDDQTDVIEQQTQFTADNPAFVGQQALLANLLGASSFPSGMNQFDAIAVNDTNQVGGNHETFNPVAMRVKQSNASNSQIN